MLSASPKAQSQTSKGRRLRSALFFAEAYWFVPILDSRFREVGTEVTSSQPSCFTSPLVLLAFVGSQATFDFVGRDKSAATCLQCDLPAGKKQHR